MPRKYLEKALSSRPEYFSEILSHPDKYRVQIIYTQINRNKDNIPVFRDFTFRLNTNEYFYPASTVKMPVAFLALEKLNMLNIEGLDRNTTMLTDSAYAGQANVRYDSSAPGNLPSIGHYIKKVFLVSDNEAFNRLYEFLGPLYINETLQKKGYPDVRVTHRLSIPLSPEENRYTNPVRFINQEGKLIYGQPLVYCPVEYKNAESILLGKGYMLNDSLVNSPKDFSGSNFISLGTLHELLKSVIFPESVETGKRFLLNESDYRFLYQCMSELPRESEYPDYADHYQDNYVKFLLYGNYTGMIPDHVRIYNKVGLAYGFLIDVAYIVDFERDIEFMLSAVMLVNEDGIFNDDRYEYDSLGFPFFQNLGELIYDIEVGRNKKRIPDLSKFKAEYD